MSCVRYLLFWRFTKDSLFPRHLHQPGQHHPLTVPPYDPRGIVHWETTIAAQTLAKSRVHLSIERTWYHCSVSCNQHKSSRRFSRQRESQRKTYRRSIVMVSSAPTSPMELIGGPPCCTWVMILDAPPAADMTYEKVGSGLYPSSEYAGGGSASSSLLLLSPFESLGSAFLVSVTARSRATAWSGSQGGV